MRRRSALSTLALCSLVIAACTGGDDDTATTTEPEESAPVDDAIAGDGTTPAEPADEPAAEEIDADLASAMWVFNDAVFETNDLWRGTDADGPLRNWQLLAGAPFVAVADSADGHVALVSDDLIDFRPVHRGCCGFTLADRLGDRIVIIAASAGGSTAFASPDGGANWTTHDVVLPGGTPENPFVPTDAAVTSQGVLVTGEPAQSGQAPAVVWRSDDLDTWTPVALPSLDPALPDGSSVRLNRGLGDDVWIVASVGVAGSLDRSVSPFRTLDGGRSFDAFEPLLGAQPTALPIADRLATWPADPEDGNQPWILVPGDGWARAPLDPSQWGDRGLDVLGLATDPSTGRSIAVVERRLDQFVCPDGAGVCEAAETTLVTSDDGLSWRDLVIDDLPALSGISASTIVATIAPLGDEAWLVWQPDVQTGAVTVNRWTGPAPIPTVDPPELYRGGPIAVGSSVRFQFAHPTWACNTDITVDDVAWVFDPPLPADPPADWPIAFPTVVEADGPNAYYDGRLDRVAEDRMIFSMRGVDETFEATPGEAC